jgi:hypothetical protein
MVRPIGWAPTCLSLDEVMLHAGHDVLIKINDVRALIVCNSPGILGQQLRFCQINLLNTITVLFTYYFIYFSFKLLNW